MLFFDEQQNSVRRTRQVKTNHQPDLKTTVLMKSDLSYREFWSTEVGETGEKARMLVRLVHPGSPYPQLLLARLWTSPGELQQRVDLVGTCSLASL